MKPTKQTPEESQEERKDEAFPGYPSYPAKDDIYRKGEEEPYTEEEPAEEKTPSLDDGLDIPGAELDDADESIGAEDEENNYYSLGGDQHTDLEENQD